MTIHEYLSNIARLYRSGNATEHSYRADLQKLIESLVPGVLATNEPRRQHCGAPDYILTRKDIPVGYIEAKDIGDKDLDGLKKTGGNKEQFDRYKASLTNLLFTDYLQFHLYREGQFVTKVSIGEVQDGSVIPQPQHFEAFTAFIRSFCQHTDQTIRSSKRLAQMMAGKAKLLAGVIEQALTSDEQSGENTTLLGQMTAFQQILIHDITPRSFADVYAQTIAYGMFAARLHDPTLPTFSRQEAAELIPKSNPFLRKLFGYIAGPDIDDRIRWIVDDLVEIFLASNVEELLKNYGRSTRTENPIIHFYETFLTEYDPALRKARGVWYTPQPVVNFIVRAVDDILKTEFGLPMGLADTSKTKVKVAVQATDKRYKDNVRTVEEEVHRVQLLDPATGTGTFLAEVVRQVHDKLKGQQGIWSSYVENHLLPRLNGFELLMASYAMAHLQMDLLLKDTGYVATKSQRLKIFLTNSLEQASGEVPNLFMSQWLTDEAVQADRVKQDMPVMCILGNPPYSISSTNKGEWIQNLIGDYKRNLNERKINLDDDYIKFIRYGQYFIDKNGSGVLAFITNNSYIDGITHRQMRKSLLDTFDKIYILDLHGNAKKKEVCVDGTPDENVFDIMQGVSINIFIRTSNKKSNHLGKVHHKDLQATRAYKYDVLNQLNLNQTDWKILETSEPNFFFQPKNFAQADTYESWFKVDEVFLLNNTGIQTGKDNLVIDFNKEHLQRKIMEVLKSDDEPTIRRKYQLEDTSGWTLKKFKTAVYNPKKITLIDYRPFDTRFIFFDNKGLKRDRISLNKHILGRRNLSLSLKRQSKFDFSYAFLHEHICESCLFESAYANNSEFPLYLYPETTSQQSFGEAPERVSNLNRTIVDAIAEKLNYVFLEDDNLVCDLPAGKDGHFSPVDLLDYIYAVLHSPTYRETYKEFLKIDFPRVPYPKDAATFVKLLELGHELRQLHLLQSPTVQQYITQYPVDGDNTVAKPRYEEGRVYINATQYFANVPLVAWNFYIGGYQPAQKWLKDRNGRSLGFEDIIHYQQIIVALTETDRLMKEIDKIEIE